MKNFLKLIFVVIIFKIFLYALNMHNNKINFIVYYIQTQKDIQKIKNYFSFIYNLKLFEIKKIKKIKNPKISVVSPVYNRGRYITRLLESIQYQQFKNIEIVIIDDCSIDTSSNIIEYFKKNDERIKLIKNKNNKGTFISRNIGVLYSKGAYIILPDPDDILSKDILKACYKYAEKYNFHLIRFKQFIGEKYTKFNQNIVNKQINQPKISTLIFYEGNELQQTDYYINNKFINKKVYIKALNIINKFYLSIYMIYMEDQIMNYFIYIASKSFYFLNKIGYYYIINSISITNNSYKIIDLRIKYIYIYLSIIFIYTKNTKYEKDISNLLITKIIRLFHTGQKLSLSNIRKDFFYYNNIINLCINSKFITKENKKILKKFKNFILKKSI